MTPGTGWCGLKKARTRSRSTQYDGAKRRIVKETYAGGQLDETRHFYHTEPGRWQVVEERVGTSTIRNASTCGVCGTSTISSSGIATRTTMGPG